MTASETMLLVVWLYFPLGLIFAAVTRSIPAKGGPGGGPGFGHIAHQNDDKPSAFWVTVALHVLITFGAPIVMFLKTGG